MPEVAERSTVEILRAARERISDPELWTTGEGARDDEGHGVDATDPAACCWCVLGAIDIEGRSSDGFQRAENALCDALLPHQISPASVNDDEGREAALALVDRAIAQLAEQEAN